MRKIISFIILLVSVILLSACGLVAWEPGNLLSEVARESIPVEGGTLSIEESELKGFSIEIPKDAYQENVDFVISTEEFNPEVPQESFNAITPLIVIDNGHVTSDEGLVVTIPIEIDSETEFVMAFYYDSDTDTYEAIPTLSYTDNEIEILTRHFSKIIVSSIPFTELLKDIENQPQLYDSGFDVKVDGLPFENDGSALSVGGYCAGSVLFSKWYYDEIKIKNQEEDLISRFDNGTPEFSRDDSDAIRMVSMVQEKLYMVSNVHKSYLATLKSTDQERFFQLAYAIRITHSPQFLEIGTELKNENELLNGHALLATEVKFISEGKYTIEVYDPNFENEYRYINFIESSGFEPYTTGVNSSDTGRQYSIIAFSGSTALYDLKQITTYYNQLLDGTIGDDTFSTFRFQYLIAENGEYKPKVATKAFSYQDIAYQNKPGSIHFVINGEKYMQYAQFFSDFKSITPRLLRTYTSEFVIKNVVELKSVQNNIGIIMYSQDYTYNYEEYFDMNIEYNSMDYSSVKNELQGTYIESSRGVNAPNWPNTRTLTLSSGGIGETSWYSGTELANNVSWIVKGQIDNYTIEVAMDETMFYEDYTYNSSTNEITINAGTESFITYKKSDETAYTYTLQYQTSNIGSGRDRVKVYSDCPSKLLLDNQFRLDVNPMFGTLIILYYRMISDDPNYKITFTNSANLGSDGYEGTDIYDRQASYNHDFHGWVPTSATTTVYVNIHHQKNEEWVVVETIEVEVTVDLYRE